MKSIILTALFCLGIFTSGFTLAMGRPRPQEHDEIKLHELPNPIKIRFTDDLILDTFQDLRPRTKKSALRSMSHLKKGVSFNRSDNDESEYCVVSFKSHRTVDQAYVFNAGRELKLNTDRELFRGDTTTLTVLDDPDLESITCVREAVAQNKPEIGDLMKHLGEKIEISTDYTADEELQLAQVLRSLTHDNDDMCGVTLTDNLISALLKAKITFEESKRISDRFFRSSPQCDGKNPVRESVILEEIRHQAEYWRNSHPPYRSGRFR